MLLDFKNHFTGRLISIFEVKSLLNISPHLQRVYVATLPCENTVSTAVIHYDLIFCMCCLKTLVYTPVCNVFK